MIIPAIIAENQCQLDTHLSKVIDKVELIHLDIMDNTYTPSSSLDFDFYLPNTTSSFEAHLMINDPLPWIKSNWWKVDKVIVHIETCNNLAVIKEYLDDFDISFGIAITSEPQLRKSHLEHPDQITILTVEPGFYGNKFEIEPLGLIEIIKRINPNIKIEVDGGITPDTIQLIKAHGVDMFVSGSYIMKSKDSIQSIKTLEAMI